VTLRCCLPPFGKGGIEGGFFFLLLLLLAQPALAIDVFVRSPRDGEIVFGEVEVALEVLSSTPVAGVEVRLDGSAVARLTAAPYRVTVDVGDENRSHTFEITATDAGGETATRTVVTGKIEVDEAVDIELQQLYVTVTHGGERVLDLTRDDFAVFDDDARQRIVTFEGGDVPLTAALLIDSSHSMKGKALSAALAGARAFVEAMAELDRAKVIVFSDRLLAATPFTGDPAEVGAVMETVRASGGTAVNDHLYLALKELEREQGRRVVVLLSDGIDGESVLEMEDVDWKAGRSQSLIYWIRPTAGKDGAYSSIWRDAAASGRQTEALEQAVIRSGGRIREIASIEEAARAFREIVDELRDQYVLGYYPAINRDDGAWHKVRVRARPPGVHVRARDGYFDDRL
jgi:Ca-activated chloride channel homolog